MPSVIYNTSVSLDGFVAGPNHEVDQVFSWYGEGDTDFSYPGSIPPAKVAPASAEIMQEAVDTTGALVGGRTTFDLAKAWNGHPPLEVHNFVVTHNVHSEWVKEGSPFTFVTDGVESAIAQAKRTAGDKNVVINTASVMRQALKAGLLDEISIDLVPVLLGEGISMFEHVGVEPVRMECTRIVQGAGVTHMRFRIVK